MSRFILAVDANKRTIGTRQNVTTTSANYAISGLGAIADTIRLANTATVGIYYALDDTAVTATTNDVYLPPGAVEFVNVPDSLLGSRNIGFICASGSTTLSITLGTMVG